MARLDGAQGTTVPDLVVGNPACSRGLELDIFEVPPKPSHSVVLYLMSSA